MHYTISGFSTALFSTWFFVEELGLIFDAGDGLSAGLLQKSRKVKQAFISHADRDHLAGLVQFNQLNARGGYPQIYYPKDCGSFPALQSFLEKFDPHSSGSQWIPIKEDLDIAIKGNLYVRTIRNNHVVTTEDRSKSLSYLVIEKKRKMKAAFASLSGPEIVSLAKEHGQAYITNVVEEKLIGYSGDTPVEDYERWDGTKILIHEATFIDNHKDLNTKEHQHSRLEEVMEMVAAINIEKLILSHFSTRYSEEEIDHSIRQLIDKYKIQIPVFRISPGKIHSNILAGQALN